jgi:hypothetical protein
VHWKFPGDVNPVQRRWLEVLCVRHPSQPGSRHRVPRHPVHVPCRI